MTEESNFLTSSQVLQDLSNMTTQHIKLVGLLKIKNKLEEIKTRPHLGSRFKKSKTEVLNFVSTLDIILSVDLNFIPDFCSYLYYHVGSAEILNKTKPYRVELNKLILEGIYIFQVLIFV